MKLLVAEVVQPKGPCIAAQMSGMLLRVIDTLRS